jgi:excinuclease ABC subunit B
VNAEVILYADQVTNSMERAMQETERRRKLQLEYNEAHGITPATIQKAIRRGIEEEIDARRMVREVVGVTSEQQYVTQEFVNELEAEMLAAAEQLDFERAAELRDRILQLKQQMGQALSPEEAEVQAEAGSRKRGRKARKGKGTASSKRVPKPNRGGA